MNFKISPHNISLNKLLALNRPSNFEVTKPCANISSPSLLSLVVHGDSIAQTPPQNKPLEDVIYRDLYPELRVIRFREKQDSLVHGNPHQCHRVCGDVFIQVYYLHYSNIPVVY